MARHFTLIKFEENINAMNADISLVKNWRDSGFDRALSAFWLPEPSRSSNDGMMKILR